MGAGADRAVRREPRPWATDGVGAHLRGPAPRINSQAWDTFLGTYSRATLRRASRASPSAIQNEICAMIPAPRNRRRRERGIAADAGERGAERADRHLHEAVESRAEPMTLGLTLTASVSAVGEAIPAPSVKKNIGPTVTSDAEMAGERAARNTPAARMLDEIGADQQTPDAACAHEAARERAAEPHARDRHGEIEADLVGRPMQLIDDDEGRRGHERVHRGRRAAAADREAEKRRRVSNRGSSARRSATLTSRRPAWFRAAAARRARPAGSRRGASSQRIERQPAVDARAPPIAGASPGPSVTIRLSSASRRAESTASRGVAHHGARRARGPRRRRAPGPVAPRPAHVLPGASAAARAADRVEREPAHQDRPAAEAIRQRAVDELADRQPENVEADRRLHRAGADAEVARRDRQGGREHMHAERAAERQQREQPERRRAAARPRSSALGSRKGLFISASSSPPRTRPTCSSTRVAAATSSSVTSASASPALGAPRPPPARRSRHRAGSARSSSPGGLRPRDARRSRRPARRR